MSRRLVRWCGGTIDGQPIGYLTAIRHDQTIRRQGWRLAEECKLRRLLWWRWHRHWPEAERESCERGRAFLAGQYKIGAPDAR